MFLIENNQAYRSLVSCLFQQSDCGLARLVHVCSLQCLWWTSAVSRPSALSLRIFWSVLVLGEREEGWGDVERRFGAVEPWSLSFLRMFTGQCSGAISGRSVWQGILVSFYLTLLFDACCEGWGFEKILLRFVLTSLVFVASYARLPPAARFHLKRQRLNFPLQRAI